MMGIISKRKKFIQQVVDTANPRTVVKGFQEV
jgi:hypothetical protein